MLASLQGLPASETPRLLLKAFSPVKVPQKAVMHEFCEVPIRLYCSGTWMRGQPARPVTQAHSTARDKPLATKCAISTYPKSEFSAGNL